MTEIELFSASEQQILNTGSIEALRLLHRELVHLCAIKSAIAGLISGILMSTKMDDHPHIGILLAMVICDGLLIKSAFTECARMKITMKYLIKKLLEQKS